MTEAKRKLLRIRKKDNLSNKELAELIGVKPDTIKKYLAEKLNPSAERMVIIDKIDSAGEILSGAEVIRLADQVEDFACNEVGQIVFYKKFPDVIRLLGKRHLQKELGL